MSERLRRLVVLCVVIAGLLITAGTAQACPMCAETAAADDHLPRAFMYSILFMLGMPAMVFTGFGVGIYRVIKRHDEANAAFLANDGRDPG